MERVKQIREKVEALINEAIELLESNYDMDAVDTVISSANMINC